MSKNLLDRLKKISPGFREDKDDEWLVYLPKEDQIRMRKWRANFLQLMEELDEIPVRPDTLGERRAFEENINVLIRETLLEHLPGLKAKGVKARTDAIHEDFSETPSRKRPRVERESNDVSMLDAEYLPFDFLPSTMTQSKTPAEPAPTLRPAARPKRARRSPAITEERAQREEPARDSYLDNIDDDFYKRVLVALRAIVERYQCRDRLLEALESFKRSHDTECVLKTISDVLSGDRCSL